MILKVTVVESKSTTFSDPDLQGLTPIPMDIVESVIRGSADGGILWDNLSEMIRTRVENRFQF
jgi:hypothetical protein